MKNWAVILVLLLGWLNVLFGANESINVDSLNGRVKQTYSGVGTALKPFNFGDVSVIGLPGGGIPGAVSITAISPIIVTPSPIINTGTVSLNATSKSNWDTAFTERLRWDGGPSSLNPVTGRASLGLGSAALSDSGDFERQLSFQWSIVQLLEGGTVNLVGDVANPGFAKYYGTDPDGNRGWFNLPTGGGGGGIPGGGSSQIQFNNFGAFGGVSTLITTDGSTVQQTTGNFYRLTDPTTTGQAKFDLSSIPLGFLRTIKIPNADSVAVVPDAGATNNFLTGITAAGAITKAQPAFSNLSGDFALTQTPIISASRLIGRGSIGGGGGDWQEITLGTGLTMSGTTLNAAGGGGGIPGGSNAQLQYNNSGAFGGVATANLVSGELLLTAGATVFTDLSDPTKRFRFNTSNIPTANTIDVVIPNSSNPVVVASDSGATNNFLTGITPLGVVNKARPTIGNLSNLTAASKLVGSGSAAASITEITLGTGLAMSGTTLNVSSLSGIGTPTNGQMAQWGSASSIRGIAVSPPLLAPVGGPLVLDPAVTDQISDNTSRLDNLAFTDIAGRIVEAQLPLSLSFLDPGEGGYMFFDYLAGRVVALKTIRPTTLTGNVNDYNPTGLSYVDEANPGAFTLEINGGTSDRNITGIAGIYPGRILRIINVGTTNKLTLKNQDAASTAVNRILLPADTELPPNTALEISYAGGTTNRWRPLSRALSNTGVTPGSYTNTSLTVDAAGRITAASSGGGTVVAPLALNVLDAATATIVSPLSVGHGTSATPVNNFGTNITFNADDSTTDLVPIGGIQTKWTTAAHGLNNSSMEFLVDDAGAIPGVKATLDHNGIFDAIAGYTVGLVAPTSGKLLQSDGVKFIPSTATLPLTAGTSGNVLTSNGSNWVSSAPAGGGTGAWGGSETGHGNTDYTILSTDRIVFTNAAFTAARVWTLPAASSLTAGTAISVIDQQGTLTTTNTLTVTRAGSDLIYPPNAGTYTMTAGYQGATFVSDGASKWYAVSVQPGAGGAGTFAQQSWTSGVWATSPYTLPTSIGTNGKMLQSNGTNAVFSAITWPTSAGTTGTILRSNGSNFANTTATFPDTAGTSGNVLTSDGTNWTSAAPTGGGGTAPETLTLSDAGTSTTSTILTLGHNSTGTPVGSFGTKMLVQAEDSTTNNTNIGSISWLWTTATNGNQSSSALINADSAGTLDRTVARFSGAGGLSVNANISTDAAAGVIDAGVGYRIANGSATSGKILKGNGTNFVASTETYAAPGTSGNVLTSDGTNWTSATPTGGGTFDPTIDNAFTAGQSITTNDATTNNYTTLLTLTHNTTGTPANFLGVDLAFQGETSSTVSFPMGNLKVNWSTITHASRTSDMRFFLVSNATAIGSKMKLFGSGGLNVGSDGSGDPGAGILNADTGFKLGGAEFPAASNGVIQRTGANTYGAVAAGTNGNVLTSNGTSWTSAAPTGGGAVPTGTGFYHTTSGVMDTAAVGESGTGNVARVSQPHFTQLFADQRANNTAMIYGNRFTDTAPTGQIMQFFDAANAVALWQVNIDGTLATGIVPVARVTGLPTFPSGTVVGTTDTQTLTNKRVNPRVSTSATGNTTPTPNADTDDQYVATGMTVNMVFGAPTGTPVDGQKLIIRIKDSGSARTLGFNAIYKIIGVTLPTTTVSGKTIYIGIIYNTTETKWDVVAVGQEA